MSSGTPEGEKTTAILEKNKFKLDIEFGNLEGPEGEFQEFCVVDTGCPDALALPIKYNQRLNINRGQVERGGAGIGISEVYSIKITAFGGIGIEHKTIAICSLRNHSPPLIGIDLLKKMMVKIDGNPNSKEMKLRLDYLD